MIKGGRYIRDSAITLYCFITFKRTLACSFRHIAKNQRENCIFYRCVYFVSSLQSSDLMFSATILVSIKSSQRYINTALSSVRVYTVVKTQVLNQSTRNSPLLCKNTLSSSGVSRESKNTLYEQAKGKIIHCTVSTRSLPPYLILFNLEIPLWFCFIQSSFISLESAIRNDNGRTYVSQS